MTGVDDPGSEVRKSLFEEQRPERQKGITHMSSFKRSFLAEEMACEGHKVEMNNMNLSP